MFLRVSKHERRFLVGRSSTLRRTSATNVCQPSLAPPLTHALTVVTHVECDWFLRRWTVRRVVLLRSCEMRRAACFVRANPHLALKGGMASTCGGPILPVGAFPWRAIQARGDRSGWFFFLRKES